MRVRAVGDFFVIWDLEASLMITIYIFEVNDLFRVLLKPCSHSAHVDQILDFLYFEYWEIYNLCINVTFLNLQTKSSNILKLRSHSKTNRKSVPKDRQKITTHSKWTKMICIIRLFFSPSDVTKLSHWDMNIMAGWKLRRSLVRWYVKWPTTSFSETEI